MPACIDSFRMPRYQDLPNVGLYLDQTVKYINGYLKDLGCMEITASMVSNYVKKGYIQNPVRKQYSAEQIANLFAIAILKSVVSMENISRLFDLQKRIYTAEVAYNYFCAELENVLHYTFGLKPDVEHIGVTVSQEKNMLRSAIVAVSHIIYLHSRFDELFGQAEESPSNRD